MPDQKNVQTVNNHDRRQMPIKQQRPYRNETSYEKARYKEPTIDQFALLRPTGEKRQPNWGGD